MFQVVEPTDFMENKRVLVCALGRVNLRVKLIFFQFLKSWVLKICVLV